MGKSNFGYHEIPCNQIIIRYKGLFDFDAFYEGVVNWAKNYDYFFHESVYKHKVPTQAGAEDEIDWHLSRKDDEFAEFILKIEVHTWDMKEVKVNVAGREKSLVSARIEIKIDPMVIMDYQARFDGRNWLVNKLSKWYLKIMQTDLEVVYLDGLTYRSQNLAAHIRKLLDMESKIHPYKGYLGEN